MESAQYKEFKPTKTVNASLSSNLDMDMRLSSLETNIQSIINDVETVKVNVEELKNDMAAIKEGVAMMRASQHVILKSFVIDPHTLQTIRPSTTP